MTAGEGGSGGRGFVYNYDQFQLLYGRNQAFSDGSAVKKIHLPMQETWVHSLGYEDPLDKEMAPCSSILAWEIPRTEEPGGL